MQSDGASYLYEGSCRPANADPANDAQCKSWFDGCNSCSRSTPGGMAACTLKYCAVPQAAYCTEHFDSDAGTPTACTMQYDPVCARPSGCANTCAPGMACPAICQLKEPQTYGNRCSADAAGAQFLHSGECTSTSGNWY